MKRLKTLLLLLICSVTVLSAATNDSENNNKITLSSLNIDQASIANMASSIDEYIGTKKINWPMTKILFYEEGGKLVVDVVAIDNTWYKLIEKGDKPFGYFILNNRLFVVSSKNDLVNLEDYFSKSDDERTFSVAPKTKYSKSSNPRWKYEYAPNYLILMNSMNLGQLKK